MNLFTPLFPTVLDCKPLRGMVVLAALCVVGTAPPAAAKATITTFDPPGSAGTHASGINKSGAIAGYYVDSSGVYHGFIRAADGTIVTFDPERSAGTYASGINDLGAVAGSYATRNGSSHAFLRASDGAITTWSLKANGEAPPRGTDATCINDSGTIGGGHWWWNPLGYFEGTAYLRTGKGKIRTFESEGASASINRQGAVTGSVSESNRRANWSSGFVLASDGTITEFNVLGMPYNTYANSINNPGSVVGDYVDGGGVSHGYLRAVDGTITTFDVSQSTGTDIYSINDKGWFAGNFADADGVSHGFAEINGKLISFDPSGSTGTFVYSMNNGGSIAGDYTDANGVYHGFVRTP